MALPLSSSSSSNAMGSVFRLSRTRLSGGAAKPTWSINRSQLYHPQIPDNQHYGEHPTYNHFVLWIRGLRPYLEKIGGDMFKTVKNATFFVSEPTRNFVVKHNPDIRMQLVALTSFALTSVSITSSISYIHQKIVDVNTMLELQTAKELDDEGFWKSQSEDMEQRGFEYSEDHSRLNSLWDEALSSSTMSRKFGDMTKFLHIHDDDVATGVPPPVSWRFNMMPYGKDNKDTSVFPTPKYEQPLRSFALSFTYNNFSGNWGDYINRTDNKGPLLRPSRPMFTDVYIPGTK